MNFFLAFAALVSLIGNATFPLEDYPGNRWFLGERDPVTVDNQTGVIVYGAVSTADVGCNAPRFTVDTATGTVLAVHCLESDGVYRLLATAGSN